MKYLTFSLPGEAALRLGVMRANRVFDVKRLVGDTWPGAVPGDVLDLIRLGPDARSRLTQVLDSETLSGPAHEGSYDPQAIRWRAPIPRPRKNIICLGLNYASHMQEMAAARGRQASVPEVPVFFSKAPTTVNGPYDPIPWDRSASEQVDYEVELGVVIGMDGKNIPRRQSFEHVFGYTIVNDVSARDLQVRHQQWFKGKSLDGFCPMGPVVVTADEFGDPQSKRVSLRVNGSVKQSATTGEMIFPVDVIIEFLSRGMTLEAGDIIATGTPAGVGLARTPPEYLRDGDLVETEIEGIGLLRNRITVVT
jgi:2-keto-4-pentenoate hydratase/2-oxohepta-3-ene-1,7-dioic acid hydratase in catechol pathway